jgi:hypothetical protein
MRRHHDKIAVSFLGYIQDCGGRISFSDEAANAQFRIVRHNATERFLKMVQVANRRWTVDDNRRRNDIQGDQLRPMFFS